MVGDRSEDARLGTTIFERLGSETTEGRVTVHRLQGLPKRPACGPGTWPSLSATCKQTLVRLCSLWRRFLWRACLAVSSVPGPSAAPPPLPSVVFSASADPCSGGRGCCLALPVGSTAAEAMSNKLCRSGDA